MASVLQHSLCRVLRASWPAFVQPRSTPTLRQGPLPFLVRVLRPVRLQPHSPFRSWSVSVASDNEAFSTFAGAAACDAVPHLTVEEGQRDSAGNDLPFGTREQALVDLLVNDVGLQQEKGLGVEHSTVRSMVAMHSSVASLSPDTLQAKAQLLLDNGITREQLAQSYRSFAHILPCDLESLRLRLKFAEEQLLATPVEVLPVTDFWTCSLASRMGPRVAFLQHRGTFKAWSLSTILQDTDDAFVHRRAGGDAKGYAAFVQEWSREHSAKWTSDGAAAHAAQPSEGRRAAVAQLLAEWGMEEADADQLAGRIPCAAKKLEAMWAMMDELGADHAAKLRIIKGYPRAFGLSVDTLRSKLQFLLHECEGGWQGIATNPACLTLSMNECLRPRIAFMKSKERPIVNLQFLKRTDAALCAWLGCPASEYMNFKRDWQAIEG